MCCTLYKKLLVIKLNTCNSYLTWNEILHLEMISNGISYLVGMNEMLKRGLLFIIVDSDWYWNGCVSTTLHKHVEQVMP